MHGNMNVKMIRWFIIALIKQSKFKIILKKLYQHVNEDSHKHAVKTQQISKIVSLYHK